RKFDPRHPLHCPITFQFRIHSVRTLNHNLLLHEQFQQICRYEEENLSFELGLGRERFANPKVRSLAFCLVSRCLHAGKRILSNAPRQTERYQRAHKGRYASSERMRLQKSTLALGLRELLPAMLKSKASRSSLRKVRLKVRGEPDVKAEQSTDWTELS